MLLRNIDKLMDYVMTHYLQFNELGKNVIGATMITNKKIGHKIIIPIMDLIPSNS